MNYSEQQALKILIRDFLSNPRYVMNNLYIYKWESDYLAITGAGYAYEIEVKISASDFRNDFKKSHKHLTLSGSKTNGVIDAPNYFYYACPEGIILPSEIPFYAGLLYFYPEGMGSYRVIKKAPSIHAGKFDVESHGLRDKFYYNMMTWKKKAESRVYGDPEVSRKKGVAEGARAVRDSAEQAFALTCPFVSLEYGSDFPQCKDPDVTKDRPSRDCILQCKRGKEFKTKLK